MIEVAAPTFRRALARERGLCPRAGIGPARPFPANSRVALLSALRAHPNGGPSVHRPSLRNSRPLSA